MTKRARFAVNRENREKRSMLRCYNGCMQQRRDDTRAAWASTIRLATAVSAVGVASAIVLESIGDVSAGGFAALVAIVGFALSWHASAPTQRTVHTVGPQHRVAVIPIRPRVL